MKFKGKGRKFMLWVWGIFYAFLCMELLIIPKKKQYRN